MSPLVNHRKNHLQAKSCVRGTVRTYSSKRATTEPRRWVSALTRCQIGMPPSAITLEELSDYFHMPEKQVAQQMGICLTSLKKICRAHGITRWPFRKLKSLERTMKKVNADSSYISAQIGKSGTEAVRSANSSVESSRAASPTSMRIDCSDNTLMQPPVRRAPASSSSRTPMTPGTPKTSASPKAESAVHRSSQSAAESDSLWPSFTISGASMQELVIINWSSLWTMHNLNKYVVRPLGVLGMTISEDGSKAYLDFPCSLAALQARRVCEEACDILRSQQAAETDPCAQIHHDACNQPPLAAHKLADLTSLGAAHASVQPHTYLSASSFLVSDSAQPASSRVLSSSGMQHDEDESSSWTLPLMPGTSGVGAPPSSTLCQAHTQRWVSSLLSPPQSCGSGSGSNASSAHNETESWLSPCLVSC